MNALLLHVLPLAAGAAISPALLGASLEVLVAFGARGRRMLLLYLAGAAAVVVAAFALSLVLPQRPPSRADTLISDLVDILLGAALLVLAIVLLVRRPHKRSGDGVQRLVAARWVSLGVLGLGVLMMATNLSTLVLVLAGAHEIHSSEAPAVTIVLGYAMLAVGALLPILLPLVWALVSPASAAKVLGRLNALLTKHGKVIGVVVCVLTAGYLIARGFGLI